MNRYDAKFRDDVATILTLVETRLEGEPGDEHIAALLNPATCRFATLARVFGLTYPEMATLKLLVALHFRPALAARFAEISGAPYVHETLVREVFALDLQPIYTSDSALNQWQLVRGRETEPGAPIALELDLALIDWLAGRSGLPPALRRRLSRLEPAGHPDAEKICKAIVSEPPRPVICHLIGAQAETAAVATAAHLKTAVWKIHPGPEPLDSHDAARLHRFAVVQNAALFWSGPPVVDPFLCPSAQLQFTTDEAPATPHHRRLAFALGSVPAIRLSENLKIRFPDATPAEIAQAAALRGLSPEAIADPAHANIGALTARLTEANTRALKDWAVSLPTNMRFDDLVLPLDLKSRLQDLAQDIRHRHTLWQSAEVARVYAQEQALTILLQGLPGTGKTLAAKVLAHEAGMPLFRVDLASLTSKYVGETAKNLRALFEAANRSGAMLFVDEFEAMASKRTEARNEIARAYNHDTAYFLQLIETAFDGVAIFATNRPMDIDEAMLRRIRHVLDFPQPGPDERQDLWQLALAPFTPPDETQAFAPLLAETFDFTGARIKSTVLNAQALAARTGSPLTPDTLRQAALAEAQTNSRMPGKRELQRLMAFASVGGRA